MAIGKHTNEGQKIKQLEEALKNKKKEMEFLKLKVSDIFLHIREINEMNPYSDPSVKRRKISELCTDARYELLFKENEEKKKRDYLSTNQSEK